MAPDFWQACDGLGVEAAWENVGLNADGKGQPQQINAISHATKASQKETNGRRGAFQRG